MVRSRAGAGVARDGSVGGSPYGRGMVKAAARERTPYRCEECGLQVAKWVGRCPECQAWGTVAETSAPKTAVAAGPVSAPARPIADIPATGAAHRPTGVAELDRCLGGGLVPG